MVFPALAGGMPTLAKGNFIALYDIFTQLYYFKVAGVIILYLLDIVHEMAAECSDRCRLRDLTPKAAGGLFFKPGSCRELDFNSRDSLFN